LKIEHLWIFLNLKRASLSVNKDGSYSGLEIELKPSASNDLNRITTASVGKVANFVFSRLNAR
jgi:hypothetical protein